MGGEDGSRRRRYRIAFIGGRGVGNRYSGIETFYEEAGSRLAARGHDVTVYCRPHFTPPCLSYRGMRVQMLPAPRSKHFETLVHSLLATVHVAARPYDIAHFHAIGSSVFSWVPRLRGQRTVVSVQGLDWQRPKWHRVARECLRFAEITSAHLPTRTVVVSRDLAEHYLNAHGIKTDIIPNGVAPLPDAPSAAVEALGLIPRRYVLFVGRLSEEKGCHELVEAFTRAEVDGVQLVFAGGATYDTAYQERLRLMSGPNVRFLGWVAPAQLGALYNHCALFVLPSRMEGLSLALLEAMGHGAPVLVSDIPPNLEAVGDSGWSFAAGDTASLADRLQTLLRSYATLRRGGQLARERATELYHWDAIVQRLESVYDSLFARGHS